MSLFKDPHPDQYSGDDSTTTIIIIYNYNVYIQRDALWSYILDISMLKAFRIPLTV
jgi:hypothetical protein